MPEKSRSNRFSQFLQSVFPRAVDQILREQLTVTENENTFFVGSRKWDESERDRLDYDRTDILEQCLDAWRDSPLGRRIVELTTQYVVGPGFDFKTDHEGTRKFINQFWTHRLNRMDSRVMELCDELTRTGNLFLLISTDQAGMSYIRALPATNIDQIIASDNDIEQPRLFITKEDENLTSKSCYAYDQNQDRPNPNGTFKPVVLHYAINRPAGAQWGEPDLAPLLTWLRRYSAWLEDRVRLNRFRNSFVYVVTADFASEAARKARQVELAANPPSPGSILVTDNSEEWKVITPKLEAMDANHDGLAIKKLIAAGVGLPMHFLAEPEGSNRTTAESAGGPTFRRFEQRQQYFMWLLQDLLQVVISRRAMVDPHVDHTADVLVKGSDISARDNVAHSIATVNIMNALERMKDMGLISDRELLRVAYRFAGEQSDIDELLEGGSGIDVREIKDPIKPATDEPVASDSGTPKQTVLP
jgi:hypothetical protein